MADEEGSRSGGKSYSEEESEEFEKEWKETEQQQKKDTEEDLKEETEEKLRRKLFPTAYKAGGAAKSAASTAKGLATSKEARAEAKARAKQWSSEKAKAAGQKAVGVASMPAGEAVKKAAKPVGSAAKGFKKFTFFSSKLALGAAGAVSGWLFGRGSNKTYRNLNLIGIAGLLFLVIQAFNFFTQYQAYVFRLAAEVVILFLLIFVGVPIGLSVIIALLDYGLPTLLINTIVQNNPPYAFLQPLANIVPEFSALTQSAVTILIVAFTPSLVMMYLVISKDTDKTAHSLLYSLGRGIYMIVVIVTLFAFFFFSLSAAGVNAVDPIAKVSTLSPEGKDIMANAWQNMLDFPGMVREGVSDLAKRQIEIATAGQYYGGTVEKSKEPVGVYIKEFGPRPKNQVFYEDEPIHLWADLEIASYSEGEEIKVSTNCNVHGTDIEGKTEPKQFVVDEKIRRETIPCVFEEGINRDAESQKKIDFIAEFNFRTDARITPHLADRENIVKYPSSEDVYDNYNVPASERNPTAEYTQGPVEIGIGLNDPVALVEESQTRRYPAPVMGITLKPRWEGEVSEFENLYVYVPEGIKLLKCDNQFSRASFGRGSERYREGTNPYSFDVKEINRKVEDVEHYTITCSFAADNLDLALRDPDAGRKVPLATKSFFAMAEYEFALKDSTTVNLKKSASEEEENNAVS